MPTRLLRDWTDSLRFDGISAEAERLFARLIMKADDYGRFHADPRLLKANCFPLLENLRTPDLVRWLDELSNRQLILRYEAEGRSLLVIVNYGQRLKQSRAKFPARPGESADWLPISNEFREVPGSSGNRPPEEKRRDIEAEEREEPAAPPAAPAAKPPLSPSKMMPVDRVKAELAAVFPDAPKHMTGAEQHELFGSLRVLDELTAEDWHACRAWMICPDRVRGRKLWPRDRAEFVSNAGQAIEAIRQWWKTGGRSWWNRREVKPPAAVLRATPPPAESEPPMSREEARALLGLKPVGGDDDSEGERTDAA